MIHCIFSFFNWFFSIRNLGGTIGHLRFEQFDVFVLYFYFFHIGFNRLFQNVTLVTPVHFESYRCQDALAGGGVGLIVILISLRFSLFGDRILLVDSRFVEVGVDYFRVFVTWDGTEDVVDVFGVNYSGRGGRFGRKF